jgi:hypothetical protein
MKTIFKKNQLVITALFLLFISCSRNSEQLNTLSDSQIISAFSGVGQIHNNGLDTILKKLKDEYGASFTGEYSKANHDKIFNTIDKTTIEYISKEVVMKNVDLSFLTTKTNSICDIKNNANKDLISQLKSNQQCSILSKEFLSAMNELNSLMDKGASQSDYNNFVKSNIIKLSDIDEKIKLVSSASIAFNSILYWNKNASKWSDFLIPYKSSSMSIGDQEEISATADGGGAGVSIAKADVTGMVTGAVGGCIWGAVGGTVTFPVVGTLAGCAGVGAAGGITGSIGNSAKTAVEHFVSWLFS